MNDLYPSLQTPRKLPRAFCHENSFAIQCALCRAFPQKHAIGKAKVVVVGLNFNPIEEFRIAL
jgi:hypothetical protein